MCGHNGSAHTPRNSVSAPPGSVELAVSLPHPGRTPIFPAYKPRDGTSARRGLLERAQGARRDLGCIARGTRRATATPGTHERMAMGRRAWQRGRAATDACDSHSLLPPHTAHSTSADADRKTEMHLSSPCPPYDKDWTNSYRCSITGPGFSKCGEWPVPGTTLIPAQFGKSRSKAYASLSGRIGSFSPHTTSVRAWTVRMSSGPTARAYDPERRYSPPASSQSGSSRYAAMRLTVSAMGARAVTTSGAGALYDCPPASMSTSASNASG
eukprot:scaffold17342_cov130-Isochrysis_galbana.AAC.5